jgi:CHAD domain-containing protein
LRKLGAKKRHKLRIAAKTLRYGIEFFTSLFPDGEKRRERMLSAHKDMQDELGALNDIAQREALARDAFRSSDAEIQGLVRRDGDQIEKRLRRAQAAHHRFASTEPFWP